MFSKKELQLAYGLAIILVVLGAVCYAAFPQKTPIPPLRLLFKVATGNVLFDHQTHGSAAGYGITCRDWHHTLEEEETTDVESCSECHAPGEGDEDVPKRADALHAQCIGCHQEFEAGPAECSACHVM
ncbi:MAG: cytochrome c3 family protein [Desulfobacterales bacterium]|nr:MAG: cytochrome c3 family protein [Desulfobacterales bacterium]